jgi:uncharacterized protein (DUF952 family)
MKHSSVDFIIPSWTGFAVFTAAPRDGLECGMTDLPQIAYKVLTAADVSALDAGVFEGAPVDRADGFIHLSTAAQLTETVERHFAGQQQLTIVAVDLRPLGAAVRWEASRHGQLFPHLYAGLPIDAVIARCPLEFDAGRVRLPCQTPMGEPRAR